MLKNLKLNKHIQTYYKCPCGSNKKFKFCCYKKNHLISEYILWLFQKEKKDRLKNSKETKFKCILNDIGIKCDNKAIRSHTISSSRNLKKLKDKNNKIKTINSNHKNDFIFDEISVRNGSVFNGLCEKHDKCYNKNIDKNFSIFDYKDYLCIFHRQMLYETFSNYSFLRIIYNLENKITNDPNLEISQTLLSFTSGYMKYQHELNDYINIIKKDTKILEKDIEILNFDNFYCLGVEFESKIPFSFSTIFSPIYDFELNLLQEYCNDAYIKNEYEFLNFFENKKNIYMQHLYLTRKKQCLYFVVLNMITILSSLLNQYFTVNIIL